MHAGVGTTSSALGNDGVLDIDTTISLETTWHAMEDLVSKGASSHFAASGHGTYTHTETHACKHMFT